MNLYIKHKAGTVSKNTLQASLNKLGLPHRALGFGIVEIRVQLSALQLIQLKGILSRMGLELVDGRCYAE